MLNQYTFNIQESLKHAWHGGIGFLRCLAAKVLKPKISKKSHDKLRMDNRGVRY